MVRVLSFDNPNDWRPCPDVLSPGFSCQNGTTSPSLPELTLTPDLTWPDLSWTGDHFGLRSLSLLLLRHYFLLSIPGTVVVSGGLDLKINYNITGLSVQVTGGIIVGDNSTLVLSNSVLVITGSLNVSNGGSVLVSPTSTISIAGSTLSPPLSFFAGAGTQRLLSTQTRSPQSDFHLLQVASPSLLPRRYRLSLVTFQ